MDLEQHLRAALAPCSAGPALRAAVMARVSASPRPVRGKGRRPNRSILFGTILVVAAAAAMLVGHLVGKNVPRQVAAAPSPVPLALVPEATVGASPVTKPATGSPQPLQEVPAQIHDLPVVKPFTVRVMPLRNDATNADAKVAVESFYVAMIDGLRAVPGLKLIETDPAGSNADVKVDFQLTMYGGNGPAPGRKFSVGVMEGAKELSGGALAGRLSIGTDGSPCTPANANDEPCADPQTIAAHVLESLRKELFPPDPSLQRQLEAKLLDSTQDPYQRINALADLDSLDERTTSRSAPGADNGATLDSAAVHGAIDLAATARDPAVRSLVWYTMRHVHDRDLIAPLIAALRGDASEGVSLQALATLSAGYAQDERARTALEAAAREDARPLVRALAQRALSGDATWKAYVVSSLKDATRTPAGRMEALLYYLYEPGPGGRSWSMNSEARKILDAGAIQALAHVLPQAVDTPKVKLLMANLAVDLVLVDDPAVAGVLLDTLAQCTDPGEKLAIVHALGHRDLATLDIDPRFRTALEELSTDDPDPQVRQSAALELKAAGRIARPPAASNSAP
ncbi:MAG TPA: HEAT repeat domain-containing protein [Steroidobacteraceae bacterium]|nr:HEAT repeat domain-containing protein [Steroidobacteraceae bacterium]